jgi:hypothetical protein
MWVDGEGGSRAELGCALLVVHQSLSPGRWRWAASVNAPLCASTLRTASEAATREAAKAAAVAWLREVRDGLTDALGRLGDG